MGVDLRLLIVDGDCASSESRWGYSHSMLEVQRRRDLWPEISRLKSHELTITLYCYMSRDHRGEHCYGELGATDPYGSKFMYVLAGELSNLSKNENVKDSAFNRGIWAMLAEIDPNTKIVLYWH